MNILIVNTFDIKGGAARAAHRLHCGLNRIGLDSVMLVKEKFSHDERVLPIETPPGDDTAPELKVFDGLSRDYITRNRTDISNTPFSLGYPGYDLSGSDIAEWADVINLHWVGKFQSVETLSRLSALGKPIVLTLHDQNAFTGGCHYSAGCTRYETDCNDCPQLKEDPHRLPYYNLKHKVARLGQQPVSVVSPSRWLADVAGQSRLFRGAPIFTIANSIETDMFTPRDKAEAKKALGIHPGHITLLTGASGWLPKRKGFGHFLAAMGNCLKNCDFKRLVAEKKILILCFGVSAPEMWQLGIPFRAFGHVDSDRFLSDIYNASDLFVLPTVEDNFPNTMLEAMGCGTPTVAFDTGGIADAVLDGVNGRLAPRGDDGQLSRAILELIFSAQTRKQLGGRARQLIESNYRLEDQARKYAELFQQLLPPDHTPARSDWRGKSRVCPLDRSFNPMLDPLLKEFSDGIIKKRKREA